MIGRRWKTLRWIGFSLLTFGACAEPDDRAARRWDEATGPGSPDPSGHAFGSPPRFEDYPAPAPLRGQPAFPDLSSHPEAARFGPALRLGVRKGPNFAGHYIIVSRSCGRLCREFAIVDAVSGVVYPGLSDTPPFRYRLDSRLIAFDAPAPLPGRTPCAGCSAAYYVWDDERLVIVPPETWVGSAPPPATLRPLIDSLRTVERPLLDQAGPAVSRPTWDRLVIAARDGSREVLADRLDEEAKMRLYLFRGMNPDLNQFAVEALQLEGGSVRPIEIIAIDRATGERRPHPGEAR